MLFSSCAEDRTHEYVEKTEHNFWIEEQMKSCYLWAENFRTYEWKDYFMTPSEFFSKLTSTGSNDNWSYIIVDTMKVDYYLRNNFNHNNSYGFDFVLMTDPTGETTKSFARVVSVFENSPADRAGLERNDFIETFDGYKLSQKNLSKLINGPSHTLSVKRLDADTEDAIYLWSDTRTVTLESSQYVEDKAIPLYKVIRMNNSRVGYAMINRLTENAPEKTDLKVDYMADLDAMAQSLRNSNITDLVLDFRLCNFGSFEMARRLASYVVPDECLDKVFAKTTWNTANSSKNESVTFDSSLAGKTLGMNKVYIIISQYTRGAAEWVILALQYALGADNVILVGSKTAGQNVLTQHIGDYQDLIHLYPAVAVISDGNDKTFDSFMPEEQNGIDEFQYVNLLGYGEVNEILLRNCLNSILNQ